jgi:hypothetical protein
LPLTLSTAEGAESWVGWSIISTMFRFVSWNTWPVMQLERFTYAHVLQINSFFYLGKSEAR